MDLKLDVRKSEWNIYIAQEQEAQTERIFRVHGVKEPELKKSLMNSGQIV